MKKPNIKRELLKINNFIAILVILANCLCFLLINNGKEVYTQACIYMDTLLFFWYLLLLSDKTKKNILDLKKETFYINYPVNTVLLFAFILTILVASAIILFTINPEAANVTFISTFFISTIGMFFPSILLIVFMYFIVPAFIVPHLDSKKCKTYNFFIKTFLFLYIVVCIFNLFNNAGKTINIENLSKYRSAKITIKYSTEFLKFKDVSEYGKKLISRDDIEVPFYYTADGVPLKNEYEAKLFCNSMNARLPNHIETYHIVFNKFDTFGEKYYWTSAKDGKHPLVLHYKNMSYHIIKKPDKVKPITYCIANDNSNYGFSNQYFFYKAVPEKKKEILKTKETKTFKNDFLKDFIHKKREETTLFPPPANHVSISEEKKYVNFSVKEVTPEIMKNLIQKGYYYNPSASIRKEYETNENTFASRVRENTSNIRLCYYPFTEYQNMNIRNEREIWEQSFCSPSFSMVNTVPALKSRHEKEAFCYAHGGRLPNIPELNGILKTLGLIQPNVKYWTSHKINGNEPVLVYYKDSRFLVAKSLKQVEEESAYAYCIKKSNTPSMVISNYTSRFANIDGNYYAMQKCPNCYYYEVPDTILQQ